MNLIIVATICMIFALILAIAGLCIAKFNDVTNGPILPEVICFVLSVVLIGAAVVLFVIQLNNTF